MVNHSLGGDVLLGSFVSVPVVISKANHVVGGVTETRKTSLRYQEPKGKRGGSKKDRESSP